MSCFTQTQLTSSIVMVQPDDFGFNQQTGMDNEFQHKPDNSESQKITDLALKEFAGMVNMLDRCHINVLVLNNTKSQVKLPDAVFPNNWFSTRSDGTVFIYPMKTPNRQAEVQIDNLAEKFSQNNYQVKKIIDLRTKLPEDQALEGTGSLIFHHPSGKLFAAYSERCKAEALEQFCNEYGYQCFAFDSRTNQGTAIYHTNVLMTCGEDFAVIAESTLQNSLQSENALNQLYHTVDDVIVISEQQMTQSFCANIIQLKDSNNQNCIVMSSSAFKGFNPKQKKALEKHGNFVVCDIPTIEHVGGGSARCMIAENFLPQI